MTEFIERLDCPACGETQFTTVWSGTYSDPAVRNMMDRFFYSADLDEALGSQSFSLVSCDVCQFRFHSRVIADQWVPIVYGEWISRAQVASFEEAHGFRAHEEFEGRLAGIRFLMRLRKLALANGFKSDELSLLDFGCGDGKLIALGRSMGIPSFGVDVSSSRVMVANASGCAIYPTLGDLADAVNKPFQMVVLSQVLEHVRDPDQILKSLGDLMTTGSILFVGVPNCHGIQRPRNFEEFHCVQPIEHINCFTPSSLKRFVERRGFKQVRKPFSVVTSTELSAVRSLVGAFVHQQSTEQFFVCTPRQLKHDTASGKSM